MASEVVLGDIGYDDRMTIYILKADSTNYINFMKPIILAKELRSPYTLSIIDTKSEWFRTIHPERYVPALRDNCASSQKRVTVFESTACLQYIAQKYDSEGLWSGKDDWEKAQIMSWTEYQTAGLGPTAKYWLYFSKGFPTRQNPQPPLQTTAKLKQNVIQQWDILEKRLLTQDYVALPDRPTIADISYLPFAMPWMFNFFSMEITEWPAIEKWAARMLARSAVKAVLEEAPNYGH